VGFDLERRATTTMYGQFMLDDIQLARKNRDRPEPASYAFTLARRAECRAPASWMLFYTRVTNLTYRNEDNLQAPLYDFSGRGRNFSDYDQATCQGEAGWRVPACCWSRR